MQREQTLILVDEQDRTLGYAPRSECHEGDGLLHRAIAVLLYNDKAEMLLQKRRSLLWDGLWDITGATHPLHLPAGDESYEEATRRCLRVEWGVDVPVRQVLSFVYFERFGDLCENEHCALLVGQHDMPVAPSSEHAYDLRWVGVTECLRDVDANPSKYTPWAQIALGRLRRQQNGRWQTIDR